MVDSLQVLLPLLYAALVVVYGIAFFKSVPALDRIKHPALIIVIVLHLLYLGGGRCSSIILPSPRCSRS